MEYKITETEVRELFNSAPFSLKEKLREIFPGFTPPSFTFVKGCWYIDEDAERTLIRCSGTDEDGDCLGYGIIGGDWVLDDGVGTLFINPRLATDKEVLSALREESKARGFKAGVVCENHHGTWIYDGSRLKVHTSGKDFYKSDGIYSTQGEWGKWLMMNGEWAKIVFEKDYKENHISMVLNYLK